MFKFLLSLFVIFNILALLILLMSCVCTYLTNVKLSKLATSKIALPSFGECKSTIIKCCLSSTTFILMDWLLYSGSYKSAKKVAGNEILAKYILIFAIVWAVMILILVLVDIAIGFQKNKPLNIKEAYLPTIIRSIWCLILAFIIV